ncbi:MAG: hypothetical protein WCV62_03085 [Candidatus Peribacteraceae bacterium]|jgi:hypothetical protein
MAIENEQHLSPENEEILTYIHDVHGEEVANYCRQVAFRTGQVTAGDLIEAFEQADPEAWEQDWELSKMQMEASRPT